MKDEKYYVKVLNQVFTSDEFKEIIAEVDITDLLPEYFKNPSLGGVTDPLGQLAHWLYDSLSSFINNIIAGLKTFIDVAKSSIINSITSVLDSISKSINSWINNLWINIQNLFNSLADTLSSLFSKLYTDITTFITNNVVLAIQNIVPSITSLLKNIIGNLSSVIAGLQSAINNTLSGLQQFLGAISKQIMNALKGVYDFFLNKLPQMFSTAVTQLSTTFQSAFNTLVDHITGAIEYIEQSFKGAFDGFITAFWEAWSKVQEFFSEAYNRLVNSVKDVGMVLQGFTNALANIWGWIQTTFNEFIKTVTGFFSWLQEQFAKGWEAFVKWITQDVPAFFNWIYTEFAKGWSNFVSWITQGFNWLVNEFSKSWNAFINWITKDVPAFFSWIQQEVWKGINNFVKAASGFFSWLQEQFAAGWNALVSFFTQTLPAWFEDFAKSFSEFISNPYEWLKRYVFDPVIRWIGDVASQLWNYVQTFINLIVSGIQYLKDAAWSGVQTLRSWVEEAAKSCAENIKNAVLGQLSQIIQPVITAVKEIIAKMLPSEYATKYLEASAGEIYIFMPIFQSLFTQFSIPMISASIFEGAGEAIGDQEVSLEPLGFGGRLRLKLGKILSTIGKAFTDALKYSLEGIVTGLSFRVFLPFQYFVAYNMRNILPVYLPSDYFLQGVVRRHYPTKQFADVIDHMKYILGLKGYDDKSINYWISNNVIVSAKTRANIVFPELAGDTTVIKEGLIYNIPSPSDLCRMMIRDIFLNPQDFAKFMQIHGYDPSISAMYYLLHFKYPTMEQLFEAYRRTLADMVWHIPKKSKEVWLNALRTYAKWQDYFDRPWIPDFIPDRDIIIELMADIPTRIDARWMYKWGIIKDEDLRRIVIARKIHDKWIDKVTVAECMNALAEERTLYRTGLMNLFEEGIITLDELVSLMKGEKGVSFRIANIDVEINPVQVTILGNTYTVKFLDGETALLSQRAYIDRLIDIKKDYQKAVIDDYVDGVIDEETFKREISMLVRDEELRNIIIALAARKKLRKQLRKAKSRIEKRKAEDIPRLAEKIVDHILDLYEAGLIPLEKAKQEIQKYVKLAEMTPEELEMIFADANVRRTGWYLRKKLSYMIKKLRKGKITVSQFKEFCRKLGIPDDLIQDMIDVEVKEYVPTISRLATLAEYVWIPDELISRVLELEGVPEEERKLWYLYIRNKPISSEVNRLVTEIITDYAEGIISKTDLENMLRRLEEFGVTPEERSILIALAELRRMRYEYRRRYRHRY